MANKTNPQATYGCLLRNSKLCVHIPSDPHRDPQSSANRLTAAMGCTHRPQLMEAGHGSCSSLGTIQKLQVSELL